MKSSYCDTSDVYVREYKGEVIVRSYTTVKSLYVESNTESSGGGGGGKSFSRLTFPEIFSPERPRIYLLAVASSLCSFLTDYSQWRTLY